MRLTFFCAIILSVFCSALTATAQDNKGYEIKIKVDGLKDKTVQLAHYYADKKLLDDSAKVDNKGNFTFDGTKPLDQGVYLVVLPGGRYFEILMNKNQHFSLKTDTNNYVQNMKVTGNEENETFYNYLNFITPKGKEIEKLSKEYAEIKATDSTKAEQIKAVIIGIDEEIKDYRKNLIANNSEELIGKLLKAMEDPKIPDFKEITDPTERQKVQFAYYKEHYFDNLDLSDDRMLRTPIFYDKVDRYLQKLTVQAPDSINKTADRLLALTGNNHTMFKYMLIYITGTYEKSNIMCLDEVPFYLFKNYFLEDKRVDWVDSTTRRRIQEEVVKTQYNLCGDVAQELSFVDTNGVAHKLSKIPKEYTVVYFWSATCGHCKKATPKLQEFYDRTKDMYDWEVYSVNIDKETKEYKKFIRKYKFDWINVNAPDNTNYFREKYNVYTTPTMYLLNHNKEIIAKKIDVSTLEKILTEQGEE